MKKKVLALTLALVLALGLTACGGDKTIKVGATPAPHAEILEIAKDLMAKDGYTLEIVEYNDYIQPNNSVEDGSLDANYFQHVPYLDDFNAERGTHLVSVAGFHIEPMGLYAGNSASLDAIPEGGKIAVPNDPTNEGRCFKILESAGVLEVDPAAARLLSQALELCRVTGGALETPRGYRDV